MKYFLIFLCVALFSKTICSAQKSVEFPINESRILLNKNLDFFLSKLQSEHFQKLNSKNKIPQFIKQQLPCFNDSAIADFGKEYQATDLISDHLPARQLTFLAKSGNIYIINYLTGGFGTVNHFTFIQYRGHKISDIWSGFGCGNCQSVNYITACIKRKRTQKFGLHTNHIEM